ncbi:hypothetical protein [Solidesulfovibrio sp.]
MIDAVDSGGYGVLGLYAAQAPVVPDPPPSPPATGPGADAAPGVAAGAAVQGSGPLPPAQAGADGSPTPGRDFGDSGQGLARQSTVLTALAASAPAARAAATGSQAPTATASGRAIRAYDRAGTATAGTAPVGVMVAKRA